MKERVQELATMWSKGERKQVATEGRKLKASDIALLATEICNRYGYIQAEKFALSLKG